MYLHTHHDLSHVFCLNLLLLHLLICLLFTYVYVSVYVHMAYLWRSQDNLGIWLSPTIWVPGIELKLCDLAAAPFTTELPRQPCFEFSVCTKYACYSIQYHPMIHGLILIYFLIAEYFVVVVVDESGSLWSPNCLELTVHTGLAAICLCLCSARIKGIYHHAQLLSTFKVYF